MLRISFAFIASLTVFLLEACAQPLHSGGKISSQDSLRGSITEERSWWDVVSYNIQVTPDFDTRTIRGWNQIAFDVTGQPRGRRMQIDLQVPMNIDSVIFQGKNLGKIMRNGNVHYVDFGKFRFETKEAQLERNGTAQSYSITIFFSGKPREAMNPPWDGGRCFARDAQKRPWMTVACQGLGASVWYPCKDHQSDEPDNGALIQVRVKKPLVAVANGKLYATDDQGDGTVLYTWQVKNPINNYNIVPYIGSYVRITDSFQGASGELPLDYWVLDYNVEKARKQFGRDVKPMLTCFEHWFGPYPFYEDGFKLVESSHLGMEHQSAIAYGNHYQNGYLGMDLSGSGWGDEWDYIIIHEAGHEWFGNNITTNDIADMWVHEGFTMYSEVLFVECQYGRKAADEYCRGVRRNIVNDSPIIGPYGVNREGSGDMYYKGANLVHTLRAVINDDSLFRDILRGLNREFFHKTINSSDVESYISSRAGRNFSKIFDQYLRTTRIPRLEYRTQGDQLYYRWANVVDGFDMPVQLSDEAGTWLSPETEWKPVAMTQALMDEGIGINKNFYITVNKVN